MDFVAYCMAGETRAKHRREAVQRARVRHKKSLDAGSDPYPTALIYAQRLGVAMEDLGRLAIAFESIGTSDAFAALREARYDELDAVFHRLRDLPLLQRAFKLPMPDDVLDLDQELREAVLAASKSQAERWHRQWSTCAEGWPLLRRLTKGLRHGSPLVPRETVLTPPGAGALGQNAADLFDRWVLVINTEVDHESKSIATEWMIADISDATLEVAYAATLDGIALARRLAAAHIGRITQGYKWTLARDILKTLPDTQRKVIERHIK